MSHPLPAPGAPWYTHIWKLVAAIASTGAALVSIVTALHSFGILGESDAHETIGNLGVTWVGLRPAIDTATAIGDTVHLAATITDKNGAIIVGARPTWTSDDPRVATVLADGSVIARGPGSTRITVAVGNLLARSRVVVRQEVASVAVAAASGDSFVVVPEGEAMPLRARALDARGHAIAGLAARWRIDDSTVAALDSSGALTGRNVGRTLVSANVDGIAGHAPVSVVSTAAAIAPVAGTGQRAVAGSVLPQAVVVRVTSRKGHAVGGQLVTFRPADGHGSAEPDTARTDADGRARTLWTLGGFPGRQHLLATVPRVDSALVIEAEAEPIARMTRLVAVTGAVDGRAGTAIDSLMTVRLTDTTGHVLPDVPVTWTALDGGTVQAVDARTDSLGEAHAHWALGKKTGTQHLRALVGVGHGGRGIPPVTFSATALSGAPAALVIASGDGQRAAVGKALPKSILVRVVDSDGNGVAGVSLVLSPSAGELTDTVMTADSLGSARIHWTMGRAAGDATLAVHVDGVRKLVKVKARATAGAAANLSFEDVPAPSRHEHSRGKRLSALVTDVYGNPVPDVRVRFSTKSGSVTPGRAVTDAKGRVAVTWVPGTASGDQTLVGSAHDGDVTGRFVLPGPARPLTHHEKTVRSR